MFRNGLKSLIEQENIGEIVGEAKDGEEFLHVLNRITPDIILMDIDMPKINGIEASEIALSRNSNLNILILSMYDDYSHYSKLLVAGVKGFISKSSGKSELERGIMAVANGDSYFSSDLLRNLIIEMNKPKEYQNGEGHMISFTKREEEILKLICQGYNSNEIAERIFLSHRTIDNYRSKLLEKTGEKNTVGLVIYAMKNKIITY
jgi:DNA-binding NarL/FixJ family response regulator